MGPGFHISNKLPDSAAAAGPGKAPEVARDYGNREAGCSRGFLLGRVKDKLKEL